VEKILDVPLNAEEKAALANSAEEVRKGIADLALEAVTR
jgi:malate/lactate dehydrogenase